MNFQLSFKKLALVCAVLLSIGLIFYAHRLGGDAPKVADLVGFFFSMFLLLALGAVELAADLKTAVLAKLEPKEHANAPIAPQRPHRYDLEYALVHAMAPGLNNRMDGKGVGEFIRDTVDAILGDGRISMGSTRPESPIIAPALDAIDPAKADQHKCLVHGVATCTCSATMDGLLRSAGYQADQAAEAEIVAAGLTAPRVTAEQIQALMDRLTWRYEQPEGTASTFAHAFLGRFYLATGHSACVSAENFNAALGQKYAREQAEGKARDKLWELEGWALHRALNAGA
ncbi:Gp49 family protein [Comamonas sp. w2-DMI]|uniref:Gp49 family protein n=1 Tax=Comamonas sp. w2-DMI TaxID=3126391 RepID=UPI0032E4E3C7